MSKSKLKERAEQLALQAGEEGFGLLIVGVQRDTGGEPCDGFTATQLLADGWARVPLAEMARDAAEQLVDSPLPAACGDELKSCPFCGGSQIKVMQYTRGGPYYGECQSCYSRGPHADTEVKAVQLWNTRTTDTELAQLRQRVAELEADKNLVSQFLENWGDGVVILEALRHVHVENPSKILPQWLATSTQEEIVRATDKARELAKQMGIEPLNPPQKATQ